MALILQSLSEHANVLFGRFHYVGPFTVLLLCGLGLPLPEEVTLIGSGLLLHQGKVEFMPIVLVCSAAILLGDLVPYLLGRRYGSAALEIRWIARVLHPERMDRVERRFEAHGNWMVFTCRFLPGIRIPGYFCAGMLGMGLPRFLLLDTAGVAISVPTSIWLGRLFGDSVEQLRHQMDNLHLILAFGLVSVILVVVVRTWARRRAVRDAERRETLAKSVCGAEEGVMLAERETASASD